jgi:hypothetical protein
MTLLKAPAGTTHLQIDGLSLTVAGDGLVVVPDHAAASLVAAGFVVPDAPGAPQAAPEPAAPPPEPPAPPAPQDEAPASSAGPSEAPPETEEPPHAPRRPSRGGR